MTTETPDSGGRQSSSVSVIFWVTLVRGTLAITLGLALLIQPDKARPLLISFMGMFWLVSGVMSIRWGLSGERARGLPLLAGIVGVLAGLAATLRRWQPVAGLTSESVAITVLGVAILLAGLLHVVGGFRTGQDSERQWSWTSFFLGLFEVIMGGLLIVEPLDPGRIVYLAASIWALIGGFILFGDALRLRAKAKEAALSKDGQ